MWSDRLEASAQRALVERLRRALPTPKAGARGETLSLKRDVNVAEAAAGLWHQPDFAWLDRPGETWMGVDPLVWLTVRNGKATVRGPGGTVRVKARGFDLVEAALAAWGGPAEAMLCGYLGYELGGELEEVRQLPAQASDPPDLHLALYDWRLENHGEGWRFRGTDAWRRVDAGTAGALIRRGRVEVEEDGGAAPVSSQPDDEGFRRSVARTVERIYNGELFQVNLCRRLEAPLGGDGIGPLYGRLRAISPASHGALIRTGAHSGVLSVSPELFLSLRARHVRSCPIKGTRPRGATPEEDRALAAALTSSEKDRAELAMIVDVTRNDLGRVCKAGSLQVARHAELMTLPTVHHTYSEVTGELREDCGAADLLRACFPPASITGAPKIRAMEVAALEEGYRRGPCMGSVGWIGLDGDMELSVAIRTAVAAHERVWYLAGCGITAESVPDEELAESQAKAVAFLRALEQSATAARESPRP